MLRRHPTSIALTQEDIATYDDTRDARAARLHHQFWGGGGENVDPAASTAYNQNGNGNGAGRGGQGDDPSDELKPLPGAQGARSQQGGRSEQDVRREREGRIMGAGR